MGAVLGLGISVNKFKAKNLMREIILDLADI